MAEKIMHKSDVHRGYFENVNGIVYHRKFIVKRWTEDGHPVVFVPDTPRSNQDNPAGTLRTQVKHGRTGGD